MRGLSFVSNQLFQVVRFAQSGSAKYVAVPHFTIESGSVEAIEDIRFVSI